MTPLSWRLERYGIIDTYHSADSATDGVGLKLTVEATSHFVDLENKDKTGEMAAAHGTKPPAGLHY